MKKLLIVGALAVALAGCQTAAEITASVQTVKDNVKAAQGAAVAVCGFLPVASSVAAIFSSGFSQSATTVGKAVCDAVTNITLADGPGDRKPRVNGVVVKGSFVK